MKLLESGVYVNSTRTNWYDPQNERAISYGHWVYLSRINGYLVFNMSRYSATTDKHQREVSRLMDGAPDIALQHVRANLDNLPKVIEQLNERIRILEKEIGKKGSRVSTNNDRREEIDKIEQQIKLLTE